MHWTRETLIEFDKWLAERGGSIIFPARELFNGAFEFDAYEPNNMTLEEAIVAFEKEYANDNAS